MLEKMFIFVEIDMRMKKFILGAVLVIATACGAATTAVGTTANKPQEAFLTFSSQSAEGIVVTIDGKDYNTETINVQTLGAKRDLKGLAGNIVKLSPGTHEISVKNRKGEKVYQQRVSVQAQEHKVIKL